MDTEKVREQLKTLRAELTERKEAIDKDIHHTEEPVEKDFAEQASQLENDEVLNALDGEAKQNIMLIDKALLRLDRGEYGICEACGETIDSKRLDVIPYAPLCISCAEKEA